MRRWRSSVDHAPHVLPRADAAGTAIAPKKAYGARGASPPDRLGAPDTCRPTVSSRTSLPAARRARRCPVARRAQSVEPRVRERCVGDRAGVELDALHADVSPDGRVSTG